MFGFKDKETRGLARVVFQRSQEIASSYLSLPFHVAGELVARSFPSEHCHISSDHIGITYPELPYFTFAINCFLDQSSLTIFGGGNYDGFLLQRDAAGHRLTAGVTKPFARPMGRKARRSAEIFQSEYGATNPRDTIELTRDTTLCTQPPMSFVGA